MRDKKGMLVVISGFSGVGKGTLSRALVEKYGYSLSVSATTRMPREGETDGIDYFFKTEHDFLNLVDYNGFIEYARYVGNYYGTPRRFVEERLAEGQVVLLEIEVQGAIKVKEQYPDALLLFITASSADILRNRLTVRGTETPDVIEKRIRQASEEAQSIRFYDYLINNEEGRPEECMETIHGIIEGERCRVSRRQDFIRDLEEVFREETT